MSLRTSYDAYQRAQHLRALNRPAQAIAVARQALRTDVANRLLWQVLSESLLDTEDVQGALEAAEQAVAHGPSDPVGYVALSQALIELGRHQAAVEAATRATTLNPHYWAAFVVLSEAWQGVEYVPPRLPAAGGDGSFPPQPPWLPPAMRAVELRPGEPASHLCLGHAYLKSGHRKLAHACAARARELAPADGANLNNVARLELACGVPHQAVRGFVRAAALDPHGPAAHNFYLTCRLIARRLVAAALFGIWFAVFMRAKDWSDPMPWNALLACLAVVALLIPVCIVLFCLFKVPRGSRRIAWQALSSDGRLSLALGGFVVAGGLAIVATETSGTWQIAFVVAAAIFVHAAAAPVLILEPTGHRT